MTMAAIKNNCARAKEDSFIKHSRDKQLSLTRWAPNVYARWDR
jgi:hypothetical protein